MLHTLTLPSGQVIGSGAEEPAIQAVALTASVGSAEPGGAQASELEVTLFGAVSVEVGEPLVLSDEGGVVGVFYAAQVTAPAPGQTRILAYDAVQKLDGSADGFLDSLTFPVPLGELARGLAAYFGLELTGTLLNADYEVPKFIYRGITGRQLMGWICQAGGRFCVAEGDGLRLGWFADSGVALLPGSDLFAYQDGCELASFSVPAPEQVVIRENAFDVGTAAGSGAALYITGNPLLTGDNAQAAQTLLDALAGFSYTPCTVLTNADLRPGQLFWVRGKLCAAVTVERREGKVRVTAPGEAVRGKNPTGVTQRLAGRVLEVELNLQQVRSTMTQYGEEITRVSQIGQTVEEITAEVSRLQTDAQSRFSQLQLRADGLEVTVGQMEGALEGKADAQTLETLAQHFRFDGDGLTITDTASGMAIALSEEAVAFTGGASTTRITPTGLVTTEAQVENRMTIGGFTFTPRPQGNLSLQWTAS